MHIEKKKLVVFVADFRLDFGDWAFCPVVMSFTILQFTFPYEPFLDTISEVPLYFPSLFP